jgi:aminoglycoside phosphotransferase (APT) family kinase protein
MTTAHAIAPDDVVRRRADRSPGARAPLLVLEPLAAYLDAHGLGAGDLEVEPLGEGHSNVTYALRRDGVELVLRRPPRPPLPPSAHDVLREARVLGALEGRARVPQVLAACADESIIGAPFTSWSASTVTW